MLYVLNTISYVLYALTMHNSSTQHSRYKVKGTRYPTKKPVDNLLPLPSLPIPQKLYRTFNEGNTKQYSVKTTNNCQLLIKQTCG